MSRPLSLWSHHAPAARRLDHLERGSVLPNGEFVLAEKAAARSRQSPVRDPSRAYELVNRPQRASQSLRDLLSDKKRAHGQSPFTRRSRVIFARSRHDRVCIKLQKPGSRSGGRDFRGAVVQTPQASWPPGVTQSVPRCERCGQGAG